jgi:hypothetical protein
VVSRRQEITNFGRISPPLEINGYLSCFNFSACMRIPPSSRADEADELWFLAAQSYSMGNRNIIVSIRGNILNNVVHWIRVR